MTLADDETVPDRQLGGKAMKPTSQISTDEVKEALLRSGYLLEHRVELFFRRKAWYVEANSAYHDPDTNKSRELDIYALRLFDHDDTSDDAVFGSVIAECVNNPQPLAFITKEDKYASFEADIKIVLDPQEVYDEDRGEKVSVIDFLELRKLHHYCEGRIATQFCSFAKKKEKSEWMALHESNQFDSFRALIKALEHKNVAFNYVEGNYLRTELIYPVLVLQGQLLDVSLSGTDLQIKDVDYLKYRRSEIWGGVETGYIIDVVTEKGLESFENQISEEIESIAAEIRLKSATLRSNIINKRSIQKSEPKA